MAEPSRFEVELFNILVGKSDEKEDLHICIPVCESRQVATIGRALAGSPLVGTHENYQNRESITGNNANTVFPLSDSIC